ncbi:MAG TPA: DUF4442 domain-containing protein [Thermoanaerobaculia bacterium]|nr:DUF4442 domain-containing protein [Thermoanaerobaculia bacterium]
MKSLLRETAFIRAWALRNVFLLWVAAPRVLRLDEGGCIIRIPLNWRTRRRDIRAMYLGVLCMGADVASGLVPFHIAGKRKAAVSIIFKDMTARFLKRAEGDVHFACEQGAEADALIQRAMETGERQEATMRVVATVPEKLGDEPVAEFSLTVSVKRK